MKTSKSSTFWRQLFFWTAGGINLMILLILFSIWRTGDRALNFMSSLFKLQPVEPKIENSTIIVQQIQDIQELATTKQTLETIVPVSADRKLGDIPVATTRLLYVARGEIKAGVDLNELTDSDIKVNNNSIEISLPPAKILDSKIDVNRSRVYDYDRGFLNLGPDVAPQLQTLAQRKTLVKIVNTACNEGILEEANDRAKQTVSQLLVNTGYQIEVKTRSPKSCVVANSDR